MGPWGGKIATHSSTPIPFENHWLIHIKKWTLGNTGLETLPGAAAF